MRYALIDQQGTVTNVILLDDPDGYLPPEGLSVIECPAGVGPGDLYDGLEFLRADSIGPRRISASELQQRLTDEELGAINESKDLRVVRLRTMVQTTRDDIDLDGETLTGGLAYLVHLGILTTERAHQIRQ